MTTFTVNKNRIDPYKNFKFRIKLGEQYVAGADRMSGLDQVTGSVEVKEHDPAASDNFKSPSRSKYDMITIERGVTHDPSFAQWVNGLAQTRAEAGMGVAPVNRKDLIIEVRDEAGRVVASYKLLRCRVFQRAALKASHAGSTKFAIEHLTLQHDGLTQQQSVDPRPESGG